MFRNLSPCTIQHNLRHRRTAHRNPAFSHNPPFECPFSGFEDGNSGLDLSIHRPPDPLCNRFQALAAPPLAVHRDREYAVSGARRRSRNSRGTKEAKKRRDARRNRRKFAAQLLNEQLSRDIDETLTKANIQAPAHIPLPTPFQGAPLTPASEPPTCTTLARWLPPTPPQLPLLDFSNFDMSDLPYLNTSKPSPPSLPQPIPAKVPSWCPAIPSLVQNGGWKGDTPNFFDLSALPERKEPQRSNLQVLKPAQPKKQSRFFPSPKTPKPTVKLPQISCKLHRCEQMIQDPVKPAWTRGAAPCGTMPDLGMHTNMLDDIFKVHSNSPSAANLWSILSSDQKDQEPGSFRNLVWEDESSDGGVALPSLLDQAISPAESEAQARPYVHLNSLVGHANERGAVFSSADALLHDSACYLDELPVPSPRVYELSAMSTELRVVSPKPIRSDSQDLDTSADHYESEQQLFEPNDIPLPASRSESPIDLATFLSMGHVEKCWCRDCGEAPELVEEKMLSDDEEWALWSMTDDESEATTAAVPQQATVCDADNEDESQPGPQPRTKALAWDDFFPCQPKRQLEPEPDFLGYLDDGMSFAHESGYDWV